MRRDPVQVHGEHVGLFVVKRRHVRDERLAAPGAEQVHRVDVKAIPVRRERFDRRPEFPGVGLDQLHVVRARRKARAEPVGDFLDLFRPEFCGDLRLRRVGLLGRRFQERVELFRRMTLKEAVRVLALGQLHREHVEAFSLQRCADLLRRAPSRVVAVQDQVHGLDLVLAQERPVIVGEPVRAVERGYVLVSGLPERRGVDNRFG